MSYSSGNVNAFERRSEIRAALDLSDRFGKVELIDRSTVVKNVLGDTCDSVGEADVFQRRTGRKNAVADMLDAVGKREALETLTFCKRFLSYKFELLAESEGFDLSALSESVVFDRVDGIGDRNRFDVIVLRHKFLAYTTDGKAVYLARNHNVGVCADVFEQSNLAAVERVCKFAVEAFLRRESDGDTARDH